MIETEGSVWLTYITEEEMAEVEKTLKRPRSVECRTCQICGKVFGEEEHDTQLCMDDVCISCHGGIEKFKECEKRHDDMIRDTMGLKKL